ncbi:hypothetical protein [Flammeovirga sp. SJP92]|uniref:hypothetical protein n=1 Tax=Flammeovirga sp. SJP92 TaxID=1775430 RepID=UPI000787ACA7|nr:hypothetical protein [Flammeovirga sp. SJP92]KXX66725.1 hypothetical protein AVL50_30705 [Flammeovirga sp. SJP92]
MTSKQLDVSKNRDALKISFKWFSPVAFFLIFFTIAWNCFLIFWYSMGIGMGSDGPIALLMFVFPLGHVAVGVGLFYYTLCLFLNKTEVKVENDQLSVKHSPLPWRGQFSLDVDDIEQLYVREVVKQGKENVSITYPLYLKKKSGQSIKVLSGTVLGDVDNAKNIENLIEDYLNIQDYAVPGEYGAEGKLTKGDLKRDLNKKINPTDISLSDLKDEFVFNYELSSWLVTFTIQYDWVSGNTDKLLQVVNDSGDNKLLYLQKQMSIVTPWIETKLENFNFPSFNKATAVRIPEILTYNEEKFRLAHQAEGKLFHKKQQEGHTVTQNFYLNLEKNKSVRVVWLSEENYSIYLGTKKEERHFDNILHAQR